MKRKCTAILTEEEKSGESLYLENENVSSDNPKDVLQIQKMGRIKRKRKISFKGSLEKILSMQVLPKSVSEAVLKTPLGNAITYQEAILLAQAIKASNGDTQAAVFIRDSSGNKLKDKEGDTPRAKKFEDF